MNEMKIGRRPVIIGLGAGILNTVINNGNSLAASSSSEPNYQPEPNPLPEKPYIIPPHVTIFTYHEVNASGFYYDMNVQLDTYNRRPIGIAQYYRYMTGEDPIPDKEEFMVTHDDARLTGLRMREVRASLQATHGKDLPKLPLTYALITQFEHVDNPDYPVEALTPGTPMDFDGGGTVYMSVGDVDDIIQTADKDKTEDEIVIHTKDHSNLAAEPLVAEAQIDGSRTNLKSLYRRSNVNPGVGVDMLVYPFGAINQNVIYLADRLGIKAGFTTGLRLQMPGYEHLMIPRTGKS